MFKIHSDSPNSFLELAFSRSLFQAWMFLVAFISVIAIFLFVSKIDDLVKFLLIFIIFLTSLLISVFYTGNNVFKLSKSSKIPIDSIIEDERGQIFLYIDKIHDIKTDQILNINVNKSNHEEFLGIVHAISRTSTNYARCKIIFHVKSSEEEVKKFILDSTRHKSLFLTSELSYESIRLMGII